MNSFSQVGDTSLFSKRLTSVFSLAGFAVCLGCHLERKTSPEEGRLPIAIEKQLEQIENGTQEAILLCDTVDTDRLLEIVLKRAPTVQGIGLSGTDVSDSGLQTLVRFPQLKNLSIDTHTRITARGISSLSNSVSLNVVEYRGTDKAIIDELAQSRFTTR
jgi:hypothetical protein